MERSTQLAQSHTQFGISHLLQENFNLTKGSTGAALNRMLKAARIHLGMEVAFISRFEDGNRVFKYVDQQDGLSVIEIDACGPLDESYCLRVVDGRLPELIHNAQDEDAAQSLDATADLGIGAHVSTPVKLADGSIFGTFCCFSFQADYSLTERDMDLIRTFAAIAGDLVQDEVLDVRAHHAEQQLIRSLLDQDDFHVLWQPVVAASTGVVCGLEILSRFPSEPYSGPAEWFSAARNAGLADELEMRAIEKGLGMLSHMGNSAYLACNASADALMNKEFVRLLSRQPLERIVLEITEHDVVSDYRRLRKVLRPLRDRGLRIAVDDAGAGYASLQHILELKPDVIKLDM